MLHKEIDKLWQIEIQQIHIDSEMVLKIEILIFYKVLTMYKIQIIF